MRFSTTSTFANNYKLDVIFNSETHHTTISVFQYNKDNNIINSVTMLKDKTQKFYSVKEAINHRLKLTNPDQNCEERKEYEFMHKILNQANLKELINTRIMAE